MPALPLPRPKPPGKRHPQLFEACAPVEPGKPNLRKIMRRLDYSAERLSRESRPVSGVYTSTVLGVTFWTRTYEGVLFD